METVNVIGQRIVEVRQSPVETNTGTTTTVDAIVLANGVELRPHTHDSDDGPIGDLLATAVPDRLPDAAQRESLVASLSPAIAARCGGTICK